MMAVSGAISHFRDLVKGLPVTVRTDHRPLVGAVTRKTDNYIAKMAPVVDSTVRG